MQQNLSLKISLLSTEDSNIIELKTGYKLYLTSPENGLIMQQNLSPELVCYLLKTATLLN